MAERRYEADSIISLREDREKVRKRPLQFMPSIDAEGALHLMKEVIDNAVDEIDAIGDDDGVINISFDSGTYECVVVDNGSGIPHEKLFDVMTVLNTSGKMDNSETTAYNYSGGVFGVGNKLATYLSTHCEVTSFRNGKYLTYEFKDGFLTDTRKGKSKEHGTVVRFSADPKLVRVDQVDPADLLEWIHMKSYNFPKITFNFTIFKNGKEVKTVLYHGSGYEDLIKKMKPDTDVIFIKNEPHKIKLVKNFGDDKPSEIKVIVDVALAYSEEALDKDSDAMVISFANSIRTYSHGSSVEGAKAGLIKFIREVAVPKMSKKEQENLQITPSDITSGLCGVVGVKLNKPEFAGQHKERIMNQEAKFAVRDAVFEALNNMKPSSQNQFIDFVKRVTRGRMASKKSRKKDVENAFSKDRSDKYVPIIYNMNTVAPELILCEGDSAASLAVMSRDSHNQAVFSVRKPKNVFDEDADTVAKQKSIFNELIDIMGIELGEKCDPSKCQFTRILGLQDGDVDGDGIFIGVASLFARYCKPVVDAGMIGRILPPAYSFMEGKKKRFIRSKREFFEFILKKFIKNVTVGIGKKELGKNELHEFLEMNFDYDEKLENLADRYCCSPLFMEYIAWKYHGDVKNQTKAYWTKVLKKYPDLKVLNEDGTLIIDGDLPGFDYINLAFDESFDRHVKEFKRLQSMNSSYDNYRINDKENKTLYQVMKTFRSYMPKGVERYKGLGELEPKELKEYCMNPETRTVIIMKFEDYEKDMEKISIIMSGREQYAKARANILNSFVISSQDLDT